MSQYSFGSGALWGTPLTNIGGSAISNPTPIKFGILQDVSVDISFDEKPLHGTYQFPVALARGKGKVEGKAKFAQINLDLWNNMIFGQAAATTTQTTIADEEAGTIPGTPYQVTVTNSATWTQDLGVKFTSNQKPLTRVASAPATGQYSVAAGVYTFAAADTALGVLISYEYTAGAGLGKALIIANQFLGNVPTFRAVLKSVYSGKTIIMDLYSCISKKLSFGTKLDDWTIPEVDFGAFADGSNNIGLISTVE